MPQSLDNLLTQSAAAAIADVPVKAVYKTVAERLPKSSLVRRRGLIYLTPEAVLCVRLDHDLPKDVPIGVRRLVYNKLKKGHSERVEVAAVGTGDATVFSYVIDPRPAAKAIAERMQRFRGAMQLIVEDPEVQSGIPTFKGTRLQVYQIASLLQQSVPVHELQEDYPNLTLEMIEAARIFAVAYPRRGRPKRPTRQNAEPLSKHFYAVPGA